MTDVATGLYRPAGSLAAAGWSVVLTPETAGWAFSGLRIGSLGPGRSLAFETGRDEVAVLPLSGCVRRRGRWPAHWPWPAGASVWAGPSDFVYAPPGSAIEVGSRAGGRFAVATARAERRFPGAPCPGIGGRGRAAWRRRVLTRGSQLRRSRPVRGRSPHRGRGPDPGRQLGLVPAPQARRGALGRDRARGDLPLHRRRRAARARASPTSMSTARASARSTS